MNHCLRIYRNNPSVAFGEPFYDWRKHVFEEFARHLRSRGMDVEIEDRETFEVHLAGSAAHRTPVRDSLAILLDDRSGNYSVLDCHDHVTTDDLELFVQDDRCKKVLKCQYRTRWLQGPGYEKVLPWTYFDRFWPQDEEQLLASRQATRNIDLMYFRGADWGRRDQVLRELNNRGLTNPDFTVVDYADYIRESRPYRVMLSLPGMAEFCHRDIECFGGGACVLRPKLKNEVYNNLIPDHHYVSVNIRYRADEPEAIADVIERRFREIIADPMYIDFVAGNAARWYDENVRSRAAMELTARLLGL